MGSRMGAAVVFELHAGGVPVEVERTHVRRLNLRVRPDGTAHLSIPTHASAAEAQRFLDAHAAWLRERLETLLAPDPNDALIALWGQLTDLPDATTPDELWRRELSSALPAVVRRMEGATGLSASGWQLRSMTSRWGSCTPATGNIRLNVRLAAYPPTCLDYVVAHELTHLAEPSHNARFHELLARVYPQERAARALLRQNPRALATVPPEDMRV